MVIVISLMILGGFIGFLLKSKDFNTIPLYINITINVLLFVLGLEIGFNKELFVKWKTLGRDAILISLAATMGSILMSALLYRIIAKKQKSENKKIKINILDSLRGSFIILVSFVGGVIIGYFGKIPSSFINSDFSKYILSTLMFLVGFNIGNNKKTIGAFKMINARIILLPIATILGTFIGGIIISFTLSDRSIMDCLAVGAGFGYYSLSSIFITEYKGIELGSIALLSNIIREIITLIFAPFMAMAFGRFAPIASGGATTADTTLPVIINSSGDDLLFLAVFHGIILDLSVPFWLSLFCSL